MTKRQATPRAGSRRRAADTRGSTRTRTTHTLILGDAREMPEIGPSSVHLVVTSPPYWTLKTYPGAPGQLGALADYECFLDELDRVWQRCFEALVVGGRMCVVVGDVCRARRQHGRHHVVPLHADIAVRCRRIGFDYLTPILWHKIANLVTEMRRPSYFLGKPYEPNAIIKNDFEYILMLRKPGGYRRPSEAQRRTSRLSREEHAAWFRPIWEDVKGVSLRSHPAPYAEEVAYRLVRMFSFAGDVVLDPFSGTGTTSLAALRAGRHSRGYEIEPRYLAEIEARLVAQGHPDSHTIECRARQVTRAGSRRTKPRPAPRARRRTKAPAAPGRPPAAGLRGPAEPGC